MSATVIDDEALRTAIERRWFALHTAVERLQQECRTLAGIVQATQADWRAARGRLVELEAARDELGNMLATLDQSGASPAPAGVCVIESAA